MNSDAPPTDAQPFPTIRWGILGCGDVCEVKSGPGFQLADGSALTMVMRRTPLMAEEFATRHGVPNWTGCPDTLIEDADVDAVYIATPPGTHCEYALKVAQAGKPCYVEKPMARAGEECDRMVQAFADAGVPLYVAYYRRALPRFLKAKELIDTGSLGEITRVSYTYQGFANPDKHLGWRVDAEQAGAGLFLDLGSHTLDILDFLLGPLHNPEGIATNRAGLYDVEDHVELSCQLTCGSPFSASWDFAGTERQDLITITGDKAELTLSTFGNEPVAFTPHHGDTQTFDLPNPKHIQQPLIQTIIHDLNGQGACVSTGESAARTSHVMDAVLQNYYGPRADGFWNNPDAWPGRSAR